MSRSVRKTPVVAITSAKSEKQDKRMANRKYRRKTKAQVQQANETISAVKEVSSVWGFSKDGKQFLKNPARKTFRK